MLPGDVISLVLPFCDYPTRQRVGGSDNETKRRVQSSDGLRAAHQKLCTELLTQAGAPQGFLRHLDATNTMHLMERRDLDHCGHAGYIDFLTARAFVGGKPVCYGKDPAGRFYLAVCYLQRRQSDVACLFQRYSDDVSLFVNSCDDFSGCVFTSHFSEAKPRIAAHHRNILKLATDGAVVLESGEEIVVRL